MGFIEISTTDRITTWRIARPERLNAIGSTLAEELRQAAELVAGDTRALFLRTAPAGKPHRRIWIAGGDLKELAALDDQGAQKYIRDVAHTAHLLSTAPFPVVTVVDGEAIGGGAEIALFGDIRLASADAGLHFKQLDVGLATGYASAHRIVDLIGLAKAQDLIYGGRHLHAAEAKALGLFHEVHARHDLEAAVDRWHQRFLSLDPGSLAAQKQMLRDACMAPRGSRAARERQTFRPIWGNPKHDGFLSRFVNKSEDSSS